LKVADNNQRSRKDFNKDAVIEKLRPSVRNLLGRFESETGLAVRENRNRMKNNLEALPFGPGKLFIAENYLEAVGIMTALKAGVALSSVRRPLEGTKVTSESVRSRTEESAEVDGTATVA